MPILYLSCAWLSGIYLGAKIAFPLAVLLGCLLPLCLIPFLPHHRNKLIITSLCLLVFFGAGLHFKQTLPVVNEHSLQFYNDRGTAEITGIVSTDPEVRDVTQFIQLSASEIKIDGESKQVSGTALIRVSKYPGYSYGDILKVNGKLITPPRLDDFDYRGYLEQQGIYSIIYHPQIEVLDEGKGSMLLQAIYSLRNRLSQVVTRTLPEPQGALAQGIVLGIRSDIPPSLTQTFARTGTAHLLAISGLHLAIVIGLVLSLGLWLFGKRYYLYIWLAFLVIWFYALFTGMRPPILRGAIMGSLFLLAEYLGRQRSSIIAITLAAAVMVGIKPQLLWDVAFQLSFLAMAGLIFLSPSLQEWGRRSVPTFLRNNSIAVSAINTISDSFAVTLSAIILTLPVIAYYFGITSLVGLPATFLALLALPAIIVTTILVSMLGLILLPLAQVLAWVDWLFLSYLILVVQAFNALPLSYFETGTIYHWQVWGYYVALIGVIWLFRSRKQVTEFLSNIFAKSQQLAEGIFDFFSRLPKKRVVPPLLIVFVLVWVAILTMPDNRLHVSFLDVGQGDAILIQTPNHQDILIDGGPSPQALNLELGKKLPFWDRTIDLVILTQPQSDHVTGLVEALSRYEIKQVLEPGIAHDTPIYQEWLKLISQKQITYNLARAGQTLDLGQGIVIEILNPSSTFLESTSDDIDNNGIVLSLSWNKVSFLFTADIEAEAELKLIAERAKLRSTVLKVAHHGSDTSTSSEFLAVVDPKIAVISAGKDNKFGHPHPEVIERLKAELGEDKIYTTAGRGTIEFITDGQKLWVKTDK